MQNNSGAYMFTFVWIAQWDAESMGKDIIYKNASERFSFSYQFKNKHAIHICLLFLNIL